MYQIALLGLALSSTIITITMIGVVKVIKTKGAQIGLTASQGNTFLWLTWSAAVLMLLATFVWFVDYCVERRENFGYEQYMEPYESPSAMQKREVAAIKANEKAIAKIEAAEMHAAKRLARPSPGYVRPVVNGVVRHGAVSNSSPDILNVFNDFQEHMITSSIPTPGMPNVGYVVNGGISYPHGNTNHHVCQGGWTPQQPFI